MHSRVFLAVGLFPLFLGLGLIGPSATLEASEVSDPPEGAVESFLRADWEAVARVLRSDDQQARSVTSRLLLGHSLLATNQNNEANALLTSATDRDDLMRHLVYCQRLVGDHVSSALAHYLFGDALARLGEYKRALEQFDAGINKEPNEALLYAARGVAHAVTGDADSALVDLSTATELDPQLLDAWLSLAVVLTRDAPMGADKSLARSLDSHQNFALGHLTASVLAAGGGDFERALAELDNARTLAPHLTVVLDYNEMVLLTVLEQLDALAEDPKILSRIGTTLTSSLGRPGVELRPTIVRERSFPVGLPWSQSGTTAYFGDNLPELKTYFEPDQRPQLTTPKDEQVIYDRIVILNDYSRYVSAMDDVIGIIGARAARPGGPQVPGPLDNARLENAGRIPGPYINAIRITEISDGTYALRTFDPTTAKWRRLPQAEAIDFLHRQLSYRRRINRDDTSFARVFKAISGVDWHPVFADFQNARVSDLINRPRDSPLSIIWQGQNYEMTTGSFLDGRLSGLQSSLEKETYQSMQYKSRISPPGWSNVLPNFDPPKREPRSSTFLDMFKLPSCCRRGPPDPGLSPSSGGLQAHERRLPSGGVSMQELAKAWINRGVSQLETAFTLGYEEIPVSIKGRKYQ